MRLVFMDEAGISKPEDEPFLVVAGVLIHGDNVLNGVENQLERIMKRQIPLQHWDDFVFHATELFNGGGKVFKRQRSDFIGPNEWPLDRRLAIADEILALPKKFSLNIAVGYVERAKFSERLGLPIDDWTKDQLLVAQHVSAFTTCSMFVEQWMRRYASTENCILVVEQNDRAQTQMRNFQQWHQSKKVVEVLDESGKQHFPFRKIRQDPLFQNKRPSSALILADFCAYVMKRILMDDKKYNRWRDSIKKQLIFFNDGVLEARAAQMRAQNQRPFPRRRASGRSL